MSAYARRGSPHTRGKKTREASPELIEKINELYHKGWAVRRIALELKIGQATVDRYINFVKQ